ncbi:MAG: collagen-binding domain-containing protein [Planctomycetota bacterium]
MRSNTRSKRRGGALVLSVVAVVVVSILAAGFLQLALSVTRRMNASADAVQARNLAEAGLAEAYTALGAARTGAIASAAAPAVFGNGLLWVEASEHANGMVELRSTAMYGTGRATLGLVAEPTALSVGSLGFFTSEDLRLNPDVRLDSYDSAQGSYEDQLDTPLNNKGIVGTNGDASVASNNLIFGKIISGTLGKVDLAAGAIVTGGNSQRAEDEVLPPVEMPPIATTGLLKHSGATPKIIPPGEAGYATLSVGKGAKVILKGPLTIAVGELALGLGSELVFDTTDGPIEMYVSESLDMATSSLVSTSTEITSDTLIFVAAPEGKSVNFGAKSKFFGFIYAPLAEVHISAQYELYGGLVCKSLQLAAQGKMHYDLALGATLQATLPVLHAWRVVDLPQALATTRKDPFQALGLERGALSALGEAFEDQLLDVRYVTEGGATQSYLGLESEFDWDEVATLLYGSRDGLAFFLPDDYATGDALANDPLVDLVNSSLSSKQLRDKLLAASPVSSEALVAACERDPSMSKSDLDNVLDANYPLAPEVLLAAIDSAALDSSALRDVLLAHSPLPSDLLAALLARIPPLSLSDLTSVLAKQ